MTVGGPGPIIASAAAFRLDVYGSATACSGASVSADAGAPIVSHTFAKGEPITLSAPPGLHAILLTAFADAAATVSIGQGCVVADLSPGASICLELTLTAPPSVPDLSAPVDMAAVQPSRCGGSSWLLCDGFEGAALASSWAPYQDSGFAGIDSSLAYRGASSLHAHLQPPAGGGTAHGTIYTHLVLPQTDAFVRMFAYVPASMTDRAYLATIVQQSSPYASIQLVAQNGSLGTNDSLDGTFALGTTLVPTGRWFCLEWQVHFNAASGYAKIWIDGSSLSFTASAENTLPSPFYYYLRIGLESAVTTPLDLWIDEVAVDSARIGCSN